MSQELILGYILGPVLAIGTVTENGGTVKDNESFTISYSPGGLTGATSVTINGIACGSVVVVDDNTITATAPDDDLLHGINYAMSIS